MQGKLNYYVTKMILDNAMLIYDNAMMVLHNVIMIVIGTWLKHLKACLCFGFVKNFKLAFHMSLLR